MMIINQINKKCVMAGILMMTLMPLFSAPKIANVYPLPKSYYNEAKLNSQLKAWAKDNPHLVRLHTIGYSEADKKPIQALQIQSDLDREPVLLVGQVHGDEVLGVEFVMAFVRQLLTQPQDEKVRTVLSKYSLWIVPTLNPDAYHVVTSGKYKWKRKNNNDTNLNGKLNVKTDGVDLNRNFPTFWHLDNGQPQKGAYYKGIAPASESETKALLELAELIRFKYAFFYHSSVTGTYSEKIFIPWQDLRNQDIADDFVKMRELIETYAAMVPKDYLPGHYEVHPNNTSRVGNARNHFFYEWGTYAYDIETGGVTAKGKSIVHPPAAQRDKIVRKNLAALFHILQR
ncbi:MAG: M14 family metallopeptidase [Candidatus Cloacimonadaceae bacterium]